MLTVTISGGLPSGRDALAVFLASQLPLFGLKVSSDDLVDQARLTSDSFKAPGSILAQLGSGGLVVKIAVQSSDGLSSAYAQHFSINEDKNNGQVVVLPLSKLADNYMAAYANAVEAADPEMIHRFNVLTKSLKHFRLDLVIDGGRPYRFQCGTAAEAITICDRLVRNTLPAYLDLCELVC